MQKVINVSNELPKEVIESQTHMAAAGEGAERMLLLRERMGKRAAAQPVQRCRFQFTVPEKQSGTAAVPSPS